VINVTSIKAPRPAVDWFSTSEGIDRAPADPTLPADKVSLSPEARSQLTRAGAGGRVSEAGGAPNPELGEREEERAGGRAPGGSATGQTGQLTAEQQQRVQELQQRDTHVRAHEAAHQAAGGDLTGPASFSFELGPDGRSYAVGGEVPVQARSGRTPDETIAIARRVRAAALAPSDPSAADLAAASAASQVELRAMQQKRQLAQQGQDGVALAGQARAGVRAATPASTPQANLERLIVRAPEAEPFM
jgi:hypothetical protein